MSAMKFTEDHEWIRMDGDVGTIGITDYAQEQLGDIVYVELPEVGKILAAGDEAAVVESVKAASAINAPAAGEVVAVNAVLADDPAKVNAEPTGGGWFLKLRLADPVALDKLMDEDAYAAYVADLA